MSLQYIIDGYNITNHPRFTQQAANKVKDSNSSAASLVDFVLHNKLCGSSRNMVTFVFDGYPDISYKQHDASVKVIFSRKESADERIKKIVETTDKAINTVVVTDDKEIRFFARACGAKSISVEEFIPLKAKGQGKNSDSAESELSYTQKHEINEELKKLWLK